MKSTFFPPLHFSTSHQPCQLVLKLRNYEYSAPRLYDAVHKSVRHLTPASNISNVSAKETPPETDSCSEILHHSNCESENTPGAMYLVSLH